MARSQTEAPAADSNMIQFVVAGTTFQELWDNIPLANRIAYFKRGVKHVLQNETQSFVGTGLAAELEIPDAEKKEALKAYREANRDDWNARIVAKATEHWENLLNGTVSADDRTRVDPYIRILNELTDKEIASRFKGAKSPDGTALKAPTNDTDSVTFANGQSFTRAMLRDMVWKSPMGAELEGKARAAADALKSTPKAKPVPAEAVSDLSALGF